MIRDEPTQTPTTVDPKEQTARTGDPAGSNPVDAPTQDHDPPTAAPTPALARFHSCRWRAQPEDGAYCTHRDVLPMAGKTGFNPESWCPDCQYFKVRRAPRKREYSY